MGYKVLVAEDDSFLQSAYSTKLSKAGFDFKVASDGEEVFEVLKTFMPDIILLDLVMPRKDGFAVLEELKKMDAYKNIPVIVTSNLGQKEDIDRATALGATEFVTKSNLSMSDLVDKINTVAGAGK